MAPGAAGRRRRAPPADGPSSQAGDAIAVLDGSGREWPAVLEQRGQVAGRGAARRAVYAGHRTGHSDHRRAGAAQDGGQDRAGLAARHGDRRVALPGLCQRAQPDPPDRRAACETADRWQTIVKTAAEQAHRALLPTVRAEGDLRDMLATARDYDLALFAHPDADCRRCGRCCPTPQQRPGRILLLIGPESGFSDAETSAGAGGGGAGRLARAAHPAHGDGGDGHGRADLICPGAALCSLTSTTIILPGIDDGARTWPSRCRWPASPSRTARTPWSPRRTGPSMLRRQAPPDLGASPGRRPAGGPGPGGHPPHGPPRRRDPVGAPCRRRTARTATLGTLGDGRFALIEPPFDRIPHDGLDNIQAVLDAGFQVVLAHPERCTRRYSGTWPSWRPAPDLGLTFQITTGSLLGRFGAGGGARRPGPSSPVPPIGLSSWPRTPTTCTSGPRA